jgi:type I restriction enzyme S subunit
VCPHQERGQGAQRPSAGSTINHLYQKDFVNYAFAIPDSREEQVPDMDTKISAPEARLVKARQLKQGMAQALLTGRIRLV